MRPRAPEQALRRLVGEIAERDPSDVRAILADLDEREREMVASMLHAYAGLEVQAADAAPLDASKLRLLNDASPWMALRLKSAWRAVGDPDDLGAVRMTPFALMILGECGAELVDGPQGTAVPRSKPKPSLVQRLVGKAFGTPPR